MIVDEYRASILSAIPKVVGLLMNEDRTTRQRAAILLIKTSEYRKNSRFSNDALLTLITAKYQKGLVSAIPLLMTLLSHDDENILMAAAAVLGNLSEHGKDFKCLIIYC
jgi:HEAT repeat protein